MSNCTLLEVLQAAQVSACAPQQLDELLRRVYNRLLAGVRFYGEPSEASRKRITSGSVQWRGKAHSLDSKMQAFVLRASKVLQLDELQSFQLLQSYLRSELSVASGGAAAALFDFDDTSLLALMDHYGDERRALLNCVTAMFRICLDEAHPYHAAVDRTVEQLVADGVAKRLLEQYRSLAGAAPPTQLR